jgi:hypothetical protein
MGNGIGVRSFVLTQRRKYVLRQGGKVKNLAMERNEEKRA